MTDTSAAIDVVINGETRSVAAATLPEVLCSLQYDPEQRGIAVAVNAEVIPRSEWDSTVISVGDRLEIVGARQGG